MLDKDFIKRICDLSCSKRDTHKKIKNIEFDTENPFKKYYSISTITGAISKYLSGDWDAKTLSGWAFIYYCILLGGHIDDENTIDDANTLERFVINTIIWNFSELYTFDAEAEGIEEDEAYKCMLEAIKHYESYDNIWQTRNNWTAIYSKSSDEEVDSIYIALVNHTSKEYLITITSSLHLEPGFEDEYFEFVTKEEHIEKIEQLKTAGYKSLSCSKDYYYEEILMHGES